MEKQTVKLMMEQRRRLETMLEESEPEEETEGEKTGEKEDEDVQKEGGFTSQEVMAEEEGEEDEDAVMLRVMRPRRLSRSLSQTESLSKTLPSSNHQEDTTVFSESDQLSSVNLTRDSTRSGSQARLGKGKRSSSSGLKKKVSKIRSSTFEEPKSVQKKGNSKRKNKLSDPFPQWVVDLMVNIEEATTHQLVVE
ncbi:cilia- and flagella-associated protein 251-like isoform X1 [Xyrichtys novacula]|uniref:Cilia- and flagella-associated protein 251-like isoform X1 n=1 Tax=Xyrichtys novacula TaxID=13765 RepID=A0AAV1GE57_XYRNO|nr:cilia- and flagella-associated protein 251-like isoform X1 [Xyrichtys novacula]